MVLVISYCKIISPREPITHQSVRSAIVPLVHAVVLHLHVYLACAVIGRIVLQVVPTLLHVRSGGHSHRCSFVYDNRHRFAISKITSLIVDQLIRYIGGDYHSGFHVCDVVLEMSAVQHDVPFLRFAGNISFAALEAEIGGKGFLLHAVHHILVKVLFGGKQRGEAVRRRDAQRLQVNVAL